MPALQPGDNMGKMLFLNALEEQKKKKIMEEQQAEARSKTMIDQLLTSQKTAWDQDIPEISKKVSSFYGKWAEMRSKGLDPLDAAKNPEAYMELKNAALDIETAIAVSKQEKQFYDLAEKKAMDANYSNAENEAALKAYRSGGIGQREPFRLKYNFDELGFTKDLANAIGVQEQRIQTPTKDGRGFDVVTTVTADPKKMAEGVIATMTRSTGPKPEAFKAGVLADVEAMSEAKMVDAAIGFLALENGAPLDAEAEKQYRKLLTTENKDQLRAYATLGRAAEKIYASVDTKFAKEFKNNPKYMIDAMTGGGGSKDGAGNRKSTTVELVAMNIDALWKASATDPQAFLSQLASKHGKVGASGAEVILNVPTDASPVLLPQGSVQVGKQSNNSQPYGSFSQFEVVLAYQPPNSSEWVALTKDQMKNTAVMQGLNARPVVRAKFNPINIQPTIQVMDAFGPKTIENPAYRKLMESGIDPKAINKDIVVGQPNYMYFDLQNDAARNMLNGFTKQKNTSYPDATPNAALPAASALLQVLEAD